MRGSVPVIMEEFSFTVLLVSLSHPSHQKAARSIFHAIQIDFKMLSSLRNKE